MILVACGSLFQLYVAIFLKKFFLQDKEVDLVLTDATPCFAALHKNEKLQELFHEVRFAKINENSKTLNRLQKSKYGQMLFEIFPKSYVKRIWEIDVKKYTECYFSSYTKPNVFLQYAIKRNGEGTKIHFFEDGISTYLLRNCQRLRLPTALRKLFCVHSVEELVDDVYVFEPELVCLEEYKNLVRIPKPQEWQGITTLFNEIFDSPDYEIEERFVFFEESFNNDGYVTNDSELIEQLWESCEGKDFILKHHPRNSVDRFKAVLPTMEVPIFWENYLLTHSIDDKVLVTVSSNTVFVPHLLCGCEPTVVMLYKIFNGTSPILGSGNFESYVEKYLSFYSKYAKKKVYIPETLDEFKEIIKNLKREKEV